MPAPHGAVKTAFSPYAPALRSSLACETIADDAPATGASRPGGAGERPPAEVKTVIDPQEARARLLARKQELENLSALSRDARDTVALDQQSVGRLSRMDALQGQAMAQASERSRAAELARIAAALVRLDAGTYGDCLSCGEEIADKRLDIDPAVTLCIACARSRAAG